MMRLPGTLIAAALGCLSLLALAEEAPFYLGSWSNGRGETLVITKTSLRFGDDRAVNYRDVTRVTDGEAFELEITTPGEINAFPGKTLAVQFEEGSMTISSYASHADFMQERGLQSQVTWEKDSP